MTRRLLISAPLLALVVGLGPTLPATNAAPAEAAAGQTVRVANANLKFKMSGASFAADLRQVVSSRPDLVTLNEVGSRTPGQLRPSGYDTWQPSPARINGNAVLWRTDRWSPSLRGYRVLVDRGPQKYDKNRSATWAILNSRTDDSRASVVSVHHMRNPAKFGPNKPLRQRLYREGMARLSKLVTSLSRFGPVFVAGDFNSAHRTNDPWGPRRTLAPAGMRAAMDVMGVQPTHDGGGTIDYVFYPQAKATPVAQRVSKLRSDHRLIVNDFRLS